MADYVFNEDKVALRNSGITDVASYRRNLWTVMPSYQYVCKLADAWKHRTLNRNDRTINSIDDAKLVCGIVRYEDKHGFYFDCRKVLTLTCLDGKTRDLAK
jgi:hypothetical protein